MAASSKFPLFVIPEELKYNEDTNKQILTIYNPFEVSLKYKILCTSPQKYRVVESQGTLRSQCCVDVVIVLLETPPKGGGREEEEEGDKFCVNLYQGTKLLGQKHIVSKYSQNNSLTNKNHGSDFKELPNTVKSGTSGNHRQLSLGGSSGQSSPGWIVLSIGLLSLLVLLLPFDGESSSWPDWIHVTVNMKLIAAFILGLVTMTILKL